MNRSSDRAIQTDRLHLSQRAQEIQHAGQTLAQTSDIRETKVMALIRNIASGRYQVYAEQVAEKIVKDHLLHLLH